MNSNAVAMSGHSFQHSALSRLITMARVARADHGVQGQLYDAADDGRSLTGTPGDQALGSERS